MADVKHSWPPLLKPFHALNKMGSTPDAAGVRSRSPRPGSRGGACAGRYAADTRPPTLRVRRKPSDRRAAATPCRTQASWRPCSAPWELGGGAARWFVEHRLSEEQRSDLYARPLIAKAGSLRFRHRSHRNMRLHLPTATSYCRRYTVVCLKRQLGARENVKNQHRCTCCSSGCLGALSHNGKKRQARCRLRPCFCR